MNAIPPFDADLLRRYDRPGPRYTSYPTAPQFSARFDEAAFRDVARTSNGDPIPRRLSLYVHVPFCFSPCFYCGCNRVITRDHSRAATYLDRLVREIAMVAPLFDRDRDVIQLHLGGGTPNFLNADQLGELMETLHRHFHFSTAVNRDISIELDPRCVNGNDIDALAFMGFNRASLGVQDFDPAVQAAVNRIQSVEETLAVVDACRRNRFRSINIDLIYGLPGQNRTGFGRTLDTVLTARPDRLAIYSYAHLPQMFRAQKQIDESNAVVVADVEKQPVAKESILDACGPRRPSLGAIEDVPQQIGCSRRLSEVLERLKTTVGVVISEPLGTTTLVLQPASAWAR